MRFTWEEADMAALDRHGWHRSVAKVSSWMRDEPRSKVPRKIRQGRDNHGFYMSPSY